MPLINAIHAITEIIMRQLESQTLCVSTNKIPISNVNNPAGINIVEFLAKSDKKAVNLEEFTNIAIATIT